MTWMFTPRSGHGASSGSRSIMVARREWLRAGASATLRMNGSLIRRTLARPRAGLDALGRERRSVARARRAGALGGDLQRRRRRRGRHGRVVDLAQTLHQARPLVRLQDRVELAAELRARPDLGAEADVDVVVVVCQRQ